MECKHFEDYLRECVEQHRTPDVVPFALHLESCPACQREWTHWQVLERAITEWNDIGDAPDLSSHVLAELVHDAPRRDAARSDRPTRRTPARWIMGATAAVLVVAIVPLVLSFVMRPSDRTQLVVQQEDPPQENLRPVNVVPRSEELSWDQLVGKTRTAYSSLLDEAGVRPRAVSAASPRQDREPEPREIDSARPTSLGLLTRDLRESVGFLGRLLPSAEPTP